MCPVYRQLRGKPCVEIEQATQGLLYLRETPFAVYTVRPGSAQSRSAQRGYFAHLP